MALASSISVLGLERVCPQKVGPWPRIFLEALASTLPLLMTKRAFAWLNGFCAVPTHQLRFPRQLAQTSVFGNQCELSTGIV